jgi:hypothetical protein
LAEGASSRHFAASTCTLTLQRRPWPTSPGINGRKSVCPSSATAPVEHVSSGCPSWRRFCVTWFPSTTPKPS